MGATTDSCGLGSTPVYGLFSASADATEKLPWALKTIARSITISVC